MSVEGWVDEARALRTERDSLKARLEEQERIAEGLADAWRRFRALDGAGKTPQTIEQFKAVIRAGDEALRAWEARADG